MHFHQTKLESSPGRPGIAISRTPLRPQIPLQSPRSHDPRSASISTIQKRPTEAFPRRWFISQRFGSFCCDHPCCCSCYSCCSCCCAPPGDSTTTQDESTSISTTHAQSTHAGTYADAHSTTTIHPTSTRCWCRHAPCGTGAGEQLCFTKLWARYVSNERIPFADSRARVRLPAACDATGCHHCPTTSRPTGRATWPTTSCSQHCSTSNPCKHCRHCSRHCRNRKLFL